MRNPEQIQIPGTEPVRGPCDDALKAWQDSMQAAADASAEKKRKLEALLDRMVETGSGRVAYTDRRTKRKKWLVLEAVQKLRTVAAEQDGEPGGGERPRGRRTARSTETPDPFAATREQMAGVEQSAAESSGFEPSGDEVPPADLRTTGQQRRRAKR